MFNSLDFFLTCIEVSIFWQCNFVLKQRVKCEPQIFKIRFVRWLEGKRIIKLSLVGNSNWKYFLWIPCPVRIEISLAFLLLPKHNVGLTNLYYHLSCFIVLNFKRLYNGFLLGSIFDACCVRSSFCFPFFFGSAWR